VTRRKHNGCPFCFSKKKRYDEPLSVTRPRLALEWHPTKNGKLTPRDVTEGSGKEVWWKCPKGDDHEWRAIVAKRKHNGCPFCSGHAVSSSNCLESTNPELAKEWHPTKNGKLSPKDREIA